MLIGLLGLSSAIGWVGWIARKPGDGGVMAAPALRVDINTVPVGVLGALPGIGPARAKAIANERAKRPFASLQDLDRRVTGIGPATVRSLAPYLLFPPAGPPAAGSGVKSP